MKSSFKNILIFVLVIVTVVVFAMILSDMRKESEKVSYGEVLNYFDSKLVSSAEYDTKSYLTLYLRVPVDLDGDGVRDLDENGIPVTKTDAKGNKVYQKVVYRLASYVQLDRVNELCETGLREGWLETYDFEEPTDTPWYITYLPYIAVLLILIFLYVVMINRAGQGGKNGFARSHAKVSYNEKNAVKFTDVAGADEEKKELEEVVEFLRDPGKFIKLGARIPRGILLVGPPGTGKTLLAKAVAGEAGVPFYSISGSDFVEMYVGVGASRVRDLFDSARKHPASIIFIDEIDAVGRHRGAGLGGGHDEREQTLNQLLVEMDGFGNHEGVIVMAATNRPDILDPALLRPGRFDRQVTVNYPDLKGREEILKVHVRNKPLEANVDLHRIAQTTVGFTGADLANLMNEAALLAAGRGKTLIGMQEIEQATLKVLVGTEKKGKIITEEDKKMTAYHEAGHAIVSHLLPSQDPVTRISIIPTSKGAGGYTLMPPVKDVAYEFKHEMEETIAVSLAGRVAEELIFNDYSGGASSDIKQATQLARRMVTVYGMSEELGTVCLAGEHTGDEVFLGRDFSSGENLSEETVAKIDREIRRIVGEGKERAKQILQQNMDKLHSVADYLMKYEVMDGTQFAALMDNGATEEDLLEINKQREEQSKRENSAAAEEREKREKEEAERIRREQEQFWNDPLDGFNTDNGNEQK